MVKRTTFGHGRTEATHDRAGTNTISLEVVDVLARLRHSLERRSGATDGQESRRVRREPREVPFDEAAQRAGVPSEVHRAGNDRRVARREGIARQSHVDDAALHMANGCDLRQTFRDRTDVPVFR